MAGKYPYSTNPGKNVQQKLTSMKQYRYGLQYTAPGMSALFVKQSVLIFSVYSSRSTVEFRINSRKAPFTFNFFLCREHRQI